MLTTHQLLNEEALTLAGSNLALTIARIFLTGDGGVIPPESV
jgi:hypothetical protein